MLFGWLTPFLSVVLNCLVIFYVFRSETAKKRYLPVALYCILQLCLIAVDITVSSLVPRTVYARVYWAGDLIAHLFITLVIVTLIRAASTELPYRRWIPYILFGLVLTIEVVSLLVLRDEHLARWMNPVSRNLSLAEEGLNLVLWTLLLRRPEFDVQLLILSAGIGMQVTGEVIGLTLRPYTNPSTFWVPNLLIQLSELICLAIWVWAFRTRWEQPSGT